MIVKPIQSMPKHHLSTPPAIPLDEFLERHNFTDVIFECRRYRCKLTAKACAELWLQSQSKWTPSGYRWTGIKREHQCKGCKRGERFAIERGFYRPRKLKPIPKPEPVPVPDFQLETEKSCKIHRCKGLAVKGENYCPRHFIINEEEKKKKGLCSVDGCDRAAFSKKMCRKHYQIEWNKNKRLSKA